MCQSLIQRGKLVERSDLQLDADTCIKELDQEGTYKYLGVTKGYGIQHSAMKEKVRKEYHCRVRMTLISGLNTANKIEVINTLVIPVVTYSFNMKDWKISEIKKLRHKNTKAPQLNECTMPKQMWTDYLPRNAGGWGLAQLETVYKTTMIGLAMYLKDSEDALLQLVREYDGRKKLFSIQKEAKKFT